MEPVKKEDLWFNTPDTHTLCRAGGNGPDHPSQMYAIRKYVKGGDSFLDYGCGSGTTLEALKKEFEVRPVSFRPTLNTPKALFYRGLDIIPKNVKWCRENWGMQDFKINSELHKIDEPDASWDVVYSRHVVDHMKSFEDALNEHCRVAKNLVIIILWVPLSAGDEHEIKNIVDSGKVYENEYTNSFSKKLVEKALKGKEAEGWKLLELTEDVGKEVKGHDSVIVLQKS